MKRSQKSGAPGYRELWGDDFYLEIMDLGLEEFKDLKPKLIEFSKSTGIPLVATNDVHCVRKEDIYRQDVLVCIQTNAFLDDEKRLKFDTQDFYLKSSSGNGGALRRCPGSDLKHAGHR